MTRAHRRRWGQDRKAEANLVRWVGEDVVDGIKIGSGCISIPVPILGSPFYAYRGELIPRIAGAGFTSDGDLIAEATAGKAQQLFLQKTGPASSAVSACQDLWGVGPLPAAGANAAATAAGTSFGNTTAGGLRQANPGGTDTLHITTGVSWGTLAGALMLYDRLIAWNINHATTANALTGTQARYTGAAGSPEYAGGVFLSGRVTTVLGATAHNITPTYTDEDGNAAQAGPATAIRVSSAVNQCPLTPPTWALPLASGDIGIRQLTNLALSAASTGNVDWFLGYPLAFLMCPQANTMGVLDGVNSAFNLMKIQTNACLAAMEFMKTATTATTYFAGIKVVSG